ncbi:MAG: uroporphyrinogen-III synthase [Mangrovibacterium sp.]
MELPSILIGGKLSAATRRWLRKQPIRFAEHPFIRIRFRKPDVNFLQTICRERVGLVVTGTYAAHWLVRFKKYFDSASYRSVYCLSISQEDILRSSGLPVHLASEPTIAALTGLIAGKYGGQRLVYLRGDNSLNDLPEQLLRHGIEIREMEVYRNTPVEKWINEVFDAYLFFSPAAIDNYMASGNFPSPKARIMTSGENTAWTAWKRFPNAVCLSPEREELSFVKDAVDRILRKQNESEVRHRVLC